MGSDEKSSRGILRAMFLLLMVAGHAGAVGVGHLCGLLCYVPEGQRNLLIAALVATVVIPLICIYLVLTLDIRLNHPRDPVQRTAPQAA